MSLSHVNRNLLPYCISGRSCHSVSISAFSFQVQFASNERTTVVEFVIEMKIRNLVFIPFLTASSSLALHSIGY